MSSKKHTKTGKVAVYIRFGNKNQDTLATQVRRMTQFVNDHPDWELVKVYTDIGSASQIVTRCAFAELIEGVRKGEYKTIAIPTPSMLGRKMSDYHRLFSMLEDAGATVCYADGSKAEEIKQFVSKMNQNESGGNTNDT